MRKKRMNLSTTHIIMLSFMVALLVGSLLLSLPISSADGRGVKYIDALFTATTATCVTGLVVVPTVSAWSIFGQIVILFLIQIGGLGLITILAGVSAFFHKKMGIGDSVLLQDAFNISSLSGITTFVKKVLYCTLVIEALGALLYIPVFVNDFGTRGIWISIFTSVSAFCNAGIDIIAADSLIGYNTNIFINIVTCALIIIGGIGYIVWWDIWRIVKKFKTMGVKAVKVLTLHSKIAIVTTLILIVLGAFLIAFFEWNNPLTIKELSFGEKIMSSLFQSVTTRTAGFATLPQDNLSNATTFVCLILMFIGGSPVGTAGGVKTVTIAVLICSAYSTVRGKNSVTLFGRNVSHDSVNRSLAVVFMSAFIVFASTVAISVTTSAPFEDIIFEIVSATGTVGVTRGLTPNLDNLSKLIVAFTMYLGRIGPISLGFALNVRKEKKNIVAYPYEDVRIG